MKSENPIPANALTIAHETIVLAVYTNASVSLPLNAQGQELAFAKPRNLKALWDTGATHSAISDRLATEMALPNRGFCTGFHRLRNSSCACLPYSIGAAQQFRF